MSNKQLKREYIFLKFYKYGNFSLPLPDCRVPADEFVARNVRNSFKQHFEELEEDTIAKKAGYTGNFNHDVKLFAKYYGLDTRCVIDLQADYINISTKTIWGAYSSKIISVVDKYYKIAFSTDPATVKKDIKMIPEGLSRTAFKQAAKKHGFDPALIRKGDAISSAVEAVALKDSFTVVEALTAGSKVQEKVAINYAEQFVKKSFRKQVPQLGVKTGRKMVPVKGRHEHLLNQKLDKPSGYETGFASIVSRDNFYEYLDFAQNHMMKTWSSFKDFFLGFLFMFFYHVWVLIYEIDASDDIKFTAYALTCAPFIEEILKYYYIALLDWIMPNYNLSSPIMIMFLNFAFGLLEYFGRTQRNSLSILPVFMHPLFGLVGYRFGIFAAILVHLLYNRFILTHASYLIYLQDQYCSVDLLKFIDFVRQLDYIALINDKILQLPHHVCAWIVNTFIPNIVINRYMNTLRLDITTEEVIKIIILDPLWEEIFTCLCAICPYVWPARLFFISFVLSEMHGKLVNGAGYCSVWPVILHVNAYIAYSTWGSCIIWSFAGFHVLYNYIIVLYALEWKHYVAASSAMEYGLYLAKVVANFDLFWRGLSTVDSLQDLMRFCLEIMIQYLPVSFMLKFNISGFIAYQINFYTNLCINFANFLSNGATYTDFNFMRFINALRSSRFAAVTRAFFSTSVFFLFFKQQFPNVVITCGNFFSKFKVIDDISDLEKIWVYFTSDFLPALLNADVNKLAPDTYMARQAILLEVQALGTSATIDAMCKIYKDWRGYELKDREKYYVHIAYYQVLNEIKSFLESDPAFRSSGAANRIYIELVRTMQYYYLTIKTGKMRKQPFCVCLEGQAFSGKSSLIGDIIATLAHPLGITTVDKGDYELAPSYETIPADQRFCENVTPEDEVLVWEDIGNIFTEHKLESTAYSTFLHVNNNIPYEIPKAKLEDKRGMWFANKLSIVTTNTEYFGSKHMYRNILPIQRRCLYYVKIELKSDGTVSHYVRTYFDQTQTTLQSAFAIAKFYTKQELFRDMVERCKHFVETRESFLLRKSEDVKICKNCKSSVILCDCPVKCDGCNEYACVCVSSLTPASIFNRDNNVFRIIPSSIMEECLFQSLFAFSNLFLSSTAYLVILLSRLLIEYYVQRSIKSCLVAFIFSMIGFVSILLHPIYNLYVAYDSVVCFNTVMHYLQLVRFHVLMDVHTIATVFMGTVMAEAKLGLNNALYGPDTNYATLRNMLTQNTWNAYVAKTFGLGFLAYISYNAGLAFARLIKTTLSLSSYTAIGEKLSQDDLLSAIKVDSIIKSDYVVPSNGMADCWKQNIHASVVNRHNGTPSKKMETNMIEVDVVVGNQRRRSFGCYSNGLIYIPRHVIVDYLKGLGDADIVYRFTKESTLHKMSFMTGKDTLSHFIHDVVGFDQMINRNTIPPMHYYVPKDGDLYCIPGFAERIPLIGICEEIDMGGPNKEPAGTFIIKEIGKLGLSGTPVYLVNQQGREVLNLVGLVSGKSQDEYIIVAPLHPVNKLAAVYTAVDPVLVEEEFIYHGFELEYKTSHKSVLNHLELLPGDYLFSFPKPPISSKTSFYKTELYDQVVEWYPDISKLTLPSLQPIMDNGVYKNPLLAALRAMTQRGTIYNQAPFISAAQIVMEEVSDKCDFSKVAPFSMHEVIRGTIISQPMNLDTSAGWPYFGHKKYEYIKGALEDPKFVEEINVEILRVISNMDKGIPPLNIAVACIKDEPVKLSKHELAKERVFFIGNIIFLILCKTYLGPVMEIIKLSRKNFFPKIGMNALGPEFHEMLHNLSKGAMDKGFLDGDFETYDKLLTMMRFIGGAFSKLIETIPFYRDNPIECQRFQLIVNSLWSYCIIFEKDVLWCNDFIPSGLYGTAEFNCLAEAAIEVLMYYYLFDLSLGGLNLKKDFVVKWKKGRNVFDYFSLANYGDDNLKYITPLHRPLYTHDRIMDFATWLGMKITPARKEESEIYYKHPHEILFLKRTPRYEPKVGAFVGQLDLSSIAKMCAYTDSKDPNWKEMVYDQALREISFHGKEKFDYFCSIFNVKGDWESTLLRAYNSETFTLEKQVKVVTTTGSYSVSASGGQ